MDIGTQVSSKRLRSIRDICDEFGISRSTVYAWMQQGLLPKPKAITARCVRFKSEEIDKVIRELGEGSFRRPAKYPKRAD